MTSDLVKRLRDGDDLLSRLQAADRIEQLEAEVIRLRAELEKVSEHDRKVCVENENLLNDNIKLRAELAQARNYLEQFADISDLVDEETEGLSDADEFHLTFHDYLLASWPLSMFRAIRNLQPNSDAGEKEK